MAQEWHRYGDSLGCLALQKEGPSRRPFSCPGALHTTGHLVEKEEQTGPLTEVEAALEETYQCVSLLG